MADTNVMEPTTEVRKSVDRVLADLNTIEVSDADSYEQGVEFIRRVKETKKVVEDAYAERKRELYKPYKAVLDEIKGFTDVLGKAEKTVRSKMTAYQTAERQRAIAEAARRRAEEEERRLEQAIETGDEEVLETPTEEPREVPMVKAKGSYTVETWHFEIIDPSKVAAEFMVPDEKAIAAYVREHKGEASGKLGEGVRVYSTQEVRVKA